MSQGSSTTDLTVPALAPAPAPVPGDVDEALWLAVNREAKSSDESAAKVEEIRYLIMRGASLTLTRGQSSETLMGAAVRMKDDVTLRALLREHADPNSPASSGESLLSRAVYRARNSREDALRVIETLLEFGADPMFRDEEGETALEHAVMYAGENALRLLLNEANRMGQLDTTIALRLCTLAITHEDPDKLEMLLRIRRGLLTKDLIQKLVMVAFKHPAYNDCLDVLRDVALMLGFL
jgi:ankyrin repeat protein